MGRSFLATYSSSALLGALLICTTCGVGRSGSPESAASRASSATNPFTPADDATIDARAGETEAKMTDDERFALLI